MLQEPAARVLDDCLERSRLFEEMRGAGHDDELLCTAERGERGAIERQHLDIIAADDQQGRSFYGRERLPGEVGTTAARNDRRDRSLMRRFGNERCCRASTGTEIPDRQTVSLCILSDPGGRHQQASGEELDIENIAPIMRFFDGQQVEEQCGKAIVTQRVCNEVVARAEAAAAAAVCEQHDPSGSMGKPNRPSSPTGAIVIVRMRSGGALSTMSLLPPVRGKRPFVDPYPAAALR